MSELHRKTKGRGRGIDMGWPLLSWRLILCILRKKQQQIIKSISVYRFAYCHAVKYIVKSASAFYRRVIRPCVYSPI